MFEEDFRKRVITNALRIHIPLSKQLHRTWSLMNFKVYSIDHLILKVVPVLEIDFTEFYQRSNPGI